MKKRKSTMVELPQDLEALRPLFKATHPQGDDVLNFLIREARAGEFHDYKNEKYDCGKVAVCSFLDQLTQQCEDRGYQNLANGLKGISSAVKNGDYDEEADQADIEKMRRETPRHVWKAIGLDVNADGSRIP